jgi:hypothetical protein
MSCVARSSSCHESSTDSAMLQRAACTSARINRCIPCRIQMVPERWCSFPSRKVSCESWVAIDKNEIVFNYVWEDNLSSRGLSAINDYLFAFLFLFPGRCPVLQSRLYYRRIKRHDWLILFAKTRVILERIKNFTGDFRSRGKRQCRANRAWERSDWRSRTCSVSAIGGEMIDWSEQCSASRPCDRKEGPRIFSLFLSFAYWAINFSRSRGSSRG